MAAVKTEEWWKNPAILGTKVMHKRLRPSVNQFTYDVYYIAIPEQSFAGLDNGVMRHNRFGVMSYYDRDHGKRNGEDASMWARALLRQCKLDEAIETLILVTMPRTMGFVFNPVSFWLGITTEGTLKAVIAEVNNTFGETHSYILAHSSGAAITADEWLEADKNFHVSPFLKVEGHYRFRFALRDSLGIWIDYMGPDNQTTLLTSMVCKPEPFTRRNMIKHALTLPMVSLKALVLIHWQAIKLMVKKVKYLRKPKAPATEYTTWRP